MRHTTRTVTAIAAAGVLAGGAAFGMSATASATPTSAPKAAPVQAAPALTATQGSSSQSRFPGAAVGLSESGTKLSVFSVHVPALARSLGTISGLSGDSRLVGLDWRVQDRKVYGVGNAGGVYVLDTSNAKATKVSQLTIALSGKDFGVDFNPAADRLRVISDTGQNLRHNVNAGGVTLEDKTLAYTPGTAATGVTAAGYTNNDLEATTGTTLIDLDTKLDQGALQVPANDGTLSLTGSLGMDVSPVAGFDILSTVRDGATTSNTGYATLRKEGSSKAALYRVDLLTGDTHRVGSFTKIDVADLTVLPPR